MESILNFFKAIWAAVTSSHGQLPAPAPTPSPKATEPVPAPVPQRKTRKMSELEATTWRRWFAADILKKYQPAVNRYADIAIKNLSKYDKVSEATGIPNWVIAAIHMRESGSDFKTHLANGDPLFDRNGKGLKTVRVPKGLGPFKSWEEGAIAALKHDSFTLKSWDIVSVLLKLEAFNGLGYRNRGVVSPYIWSFTDQYSAGKYVRDGVYDPKTVDKQCGCAALIMELIDRKAIKVLEVSPG